MTDIMGYPAATVRRATEVNERLKGATTPDEAVEVMRGEPFAVFQFIDEKSGYFGSDGYHDGYAFLRQARNGASTTDLFDVLER